MENASSQTPYPGKHINESLLRQQPTHAEIPPYTIFQSHRAEDTPAYCRTRDGPDDDQYRREAVSAVHEYL